jgi:Zn-dependent M28 family amino/carboxypeptidase
VPKIPAAAISTEDADWIDRLSRAGVKVEVELDLGAEQLAEVLSHNVVGELKGGRWPEQIVLVGAHLDSWDVGQGAHDDGAGVVQVLEVLRQIKAMGTPGRTVRGVLYTNEENGLRGGKAYAQAHAAERHVAAIETDLGGGWPLGWGATGSPAQLAWLRKAAAPLGLPLSEGGGGADIGPLGEQGALLIGLRPDDSRYFDVHHTQADTLDKVDPTALSEGAAALSALVWRLAQAEP